MQFYPAADLLRVRIAETGNVVRSAIVPNLGVG
jgi:hypothetical protein